MKDLPTIKQMKKFFKDNLKTIFATAGVCLVLFFGAVGYTIYSNDAALKRVESVTGKEITPITGAEYSKLNKNKVRFLFFVENEEGNLFANPNLFESILLSDDVLAESGAEALIPKGVAPEFVIDVTYDDVTSGLFVTVGTGDYNTNLALANLLYETVSTDKLGFFDNKDVYMLTEPEKVSKKLESLTDANISVMEYVVYGVAVLILSVIMGLFIAAVRMVTNKEISDGFSYKYAEDDLVMDLTEMGGEVNQPLALVQAIRHPAKDTKLVLAQRLDAKELQEKLITKEGTGKFIVKNDILEVSADTHFDEIIIISEKNQTTKQWYKNQRIQLENYHSPIKIILI